MAYYPKSPYGVNAAALDPRLRSMANPFALPRALTPAVSSLVSGARHGSGAGAQSLLHLVLHEPIGPDPDRGERVQEPYRQEGEATGCLLPLFRRKYEPKTLKVE